MFASKIGSANTYLKCLKELDSWGYIKYVPSRNPMKGSQVYLYKINTSTDTSSDTTTDTSPVQVLRPSINNTKLIKQKQTHKTYEKKSKDDSQIIKNKKENKDETLFVQDLGKVDSRVNHKHSFPSSLEEVQVYFSEKEFPPTEAEKFYNYFESNGWLVGGRSKMKNWKAAANNWILNFKKFNPIQKENHYHTNQDKDYSIPL